MEPPAGTLHLPNSEPFRLPHKRVASRSAEAGAEEHEAVRFTVFLPHTCT